MIFENGERVMTYQSNKTLTDSEKELMQQKFETLKTDEIYDIVFTTSTVNILYHPTLMMDRLSMIDPSEIVHEVIEEVVGVLK